MDLVQLIKTVRQGASVEEIVALHSPDLIAEEIGIYMKNEASLTSQLAFFDLEQVPPYSFITVGEKKYEDFFCV